MGDQIFQFSEHKLERIACMYLNMYAYMQVRSATDEVYLQYKYKSKFGQGNLDCPNIDAHKKGNEYIRAFSHCRWIN